VNRIDPTGLLYDPGKLGREAGKALCRLQCGGQYEACKQLSPHMAGMGFDYDKCADTCGDAIDDAVGDVEDVFKLAEAPLALKDALENLGNLLRYRRSNRGASML
jgi:hypothetical protein